LSAETPVGSVLELVEYLRGGEKPVERFRIGTEHEKIGLRVDDHGSVPYEGERGIGAILETIAREDGWNPVLEAGNAIALEKDGASITLEPGGQLELSDAPVRTIFETCAVFNSHLDLIRRVSEPLGLIWLSLGCNPLHGVADVPRMPKARYRIMRDYLPARGAFSLHMMHLTATVQANLDYSTRPTWRRSAPRWDHARRLRHLRQLQHLGGGSKRLTRVITGYTDPDRCGLLPAST
jgi:glutamate--cysteine ligase